MKMQFNEFKNIIEKTRCVRRYQNNYKVNTQDLVGLIDLARLTSSARNIQALKYIIINDEIHYKTIHKPIKWATNLEDWNQSNEEKPSAYILILKDKLLEGYPEVDLGISLQTIMIGLSLKGLNGCMLGSIDKESYSKELELDDNLEPMVAVSVGKSDETINITTVENNSTNYYRNDKDEHCVPKRSLDDVLLKIYD